MTLIFPFETEVIFRPPEYFWLVFLLPFLIIPIVWEWFKRNKTIFDDPWNRVHFSTSKIPTMSERIFWWIACAVATGFLVVAYANPERVTTEWERVFKQIRITFILDISGSMKKAEDISPNRLEASKEVIRNLVMAFEYDKELKGKYPIALIPFSGAALPYYTQFTISRDEFLNHLESLDIETITKRGTSLWAAVKAYDELLLANLARDPKTLDLGILISDGGKEEGKKEKALLPKEIANLRDPYRTPYFLLSGERIITRSKEPIKKVVIHSVGVGKVEVDNSGKRVVKPVNLKNRDKLGTFLGYQHLVDNDTKSPIETSTLDEQVLRELAEAGGGKYWHFSDKDTIFKEFKTLILNSRHEIDRIPHYQHESARSWFLVPSFIIFYFLFGYGQWLMKIARWLIKGIKVVFSVAFLIILISSSVEGYDGAKIKEISEKSPNVVSVEAYKFGDSKEKGSYGTGVIISLSNVGEFVVLTNDHVVNGADRIYISFYKRNIKLEAIIIGEDPGLDIAILKIPETPRGIIAAKLGDSSLLNHGDEVYALGNPFGFRSITAGVITALEFHDWRYIVSQTPLNPGNSGGPLFNKNHEVIAINTAIAQGSNLINFSIPINYIKRIIPRLIREQVVRHGKLGFEFDDSFIIPFYFFKDHNIPYPPRREEIMISKLSSTVTETTINIRKGDVISKFNGVSYTKAKDLSIKIFFDHRPGDRVSLTIERNGQVFERAIILQKEEPTR